MSDPRTILTRTVKVGERITFDDGRIVLELLERSGRSSSRIRFDLARDVVVNRPSRIVEMAARGLEERA